MLDRQKIGVSRRDETEYVIAVLVGFRGKKPGCFKLTSLLRELALVTVVRLSRFAEKFPLSFLIPVAERRNIRV
jgi:hypothetical protein